MPGYLRAKISRISVVNAARFATGSAEKIDPAHAAHGHPAPAAQAERKVLYWHDPMYPQQRFDKPGKSPFMDMDLVPVYAEGADQGGVSVSARITQNLGVRTVVVGGVSLNVGVTNLSMDAMNRGYDVVAPRDAKYHRAESTPISARSSSRGMNVPARFDMLSSSPSRMNRTHATSSISSDSFGYPIASAALRTRATVP